MKDCFAEQQMGAAFELGSDICHREIPSFRIAECDFRIPTAQRAKVAAEGKFTRLRQAHFPDRLDGFDRVVALCARAARNPNTRASHSRKSIVAKIFSLG